MADTRRPNKPSPAKRPAPKGPPPGKLAKGAAARRAAERKRRQRTVIYTSFVVVVIAALVAVIVLANRDTTTGAPNVDAAALTAARTAAGCGEVQEIAQAASNQHIAPNAQPADWNSNPPTSGQHLATPLPGGFYDQQQDERMVVHSLEHGYVAVQYRNLPADQVEELRRLAERYRGQKLVIQPYQDLQRDGVALTAWQFLQTCQRANATAIEGFMADFMVGGGSGRRSKAPEPTAA